MKFSEKCYALLKKVPRGKLTTYKEIAKALKSRAYRVVGRAMKNNPYAPDVPCHRVICSDGRIGGYMGKKRKNILEKINLLESEGVEIRDNKINLARYLYKFKS